MKKIMDLTRELWAMLPSERRGEFDWAKRVDRVNQNATDGYAFIGPFVKRGTVEIEVKPKVYLVKTVQGSRYSATKHYSVITMDREGNLTLTDIYTNSRTPGWALRIRNAVAELLEELKGEAAKAAPQPEKGREMSKMSGKMVTKAAVLPPVKDPEGWVIGFGVRLGSTLHIPVQDVLSFRGVSEEYGEELFEIKFALPQEACDAITGSKKWRLYVAETGDQITGFDDKVFDNCHGEWAALWWLLNERILELRSEE